MISFQKFLYVTTGLVTCGVVSCVGNGVNNNKEGIQQTIVNSKECHYIQMLWYIELFFSIIMIMLGNASPVRILVNINGYVGHSATQSFYL